MNKLKSIIRNTELDGFTDTIVQLFKDDAKAQTDTFLKATLAELEALSAQITTVILQDKVLSTLDAADSRRDEAIKTLGAVLGGYAVFPIASKKELAEPLKAIYDKYSKAGIITASYTSESSMIESMLEDFAADSVAENIKGLEGVAEAIALIRTAQDDFSKANVEYLKASTNKGASATSLNKPIVSLVNEKLVPYLNAMVIASNANCTEFAGKVETEIKRTNEIIAKRGKKPVEE